MEKQLGEQVLDAAVGFRQSLSTRPVGVSLSPEELARRIDAQLPEAGESASRAIEALIDGAEGGLIASAGGRYFGFVLGGAPSVSVAADWLTSTWDQNAQSYGTSPAAALIEDVVAAWLLDLLQLPADSSVGFVSGAQMANFVALSAARNASLRRHGWDFDHHGLQGSPQLHVASGECCHGTVLSALRMMGLGEANIRPVPADDQGRMRVQALRETLAECPGPTIVCAQAGNVNTGAFDPLDDIATAARSHGAWLHIDGAFGLWARAAPGLEHLCTGAELADSWATDAHKWPGVPYDSGLVILRDPAAHRSIKTARCAYAGPELQGRRDGFAWVPENSRRARGFVLYATLRHLGRRGVARVVEGCCTHAQMLARELARWPDTRVLAEVVLNQVLFRFEPAGIEDHDTLNESVAHRVQSDGECWLGSTRWQGRTALRISVANSATTEDDVGRALASLESALALELRGPTLERQQ